jgi:putative heme transporter
MTEPRDVDVTAQPSSRPGEAATEPIESQIRPVRVALGVVIAIVVGVVLVGAIGRVAGFSKLTETLSDADERWLMVCAVGQVIVFAGYTGAFRRAVAFEGGPQVSTSLSLRVVLASFGLSQLVAAGGAAGLAVTYWALRRVGMARRAAAVRMIGLATAVYFVFGLLGWAAALVALVRAQAPLGMTLPWLVAVPLLLVGARWFTDAGRVERWTTPTGGFLRQALATGVEAAWWVRRAERVPEGRTILGWAACYWLGDVASLWGALHAFGADPGLVPLVLVYATGYLAQSVPIPFIATGGMDAATTFALTAVGVPLDVALLAVVAHRLFAFWIPLIPGLVCAAFLPRTGQALAAAGGGPAGRKPLHA